MKKSSAPQNSEVLRKRRGPFSRKWRPWKHHAASIAERVSHATDAGIFVQTTRSRKGPTGSIPSTSTTARVAACVRKSANEAPFSLERRGFMSKNRVLMGSKVVAEAVRLARPEVVTVYPITPQTGIIEAL